MTPQEFDDFLQKTLADRRLTGSEKGVLTQLLADDLADERKLSAFRSKAFAAARAAMLAPDAVGVLDWLEEVNKTLIPRPAAPREESVAEAHFAPGEQCWKAIARQLGRARSRADLCVFTITDDRISSAILEANRRKVALRIISDNEKALDPGSDIERLRQAGIPLLIDHTPFHMHHKFALFDNEALLTGSYNWTRSAADSNEENLIITTDPRLVRPFSQVFEELWNKLA